MLLVDRVEKIQITCFSTIMIFDIRIDEDQIWELIFILINSMGIIKLVE